MPKLRDLPPGRLAPQPFTGNLNMSSTTVRTAFNKDARILQVTIHFDAGTSNPVAIYYDSIDGAAYDTLLRSIPCAGATDILWIPPAKLAIEKGDEIYLTWTNDGSITYGVKIEAEEI